MASSRGMSQAVVSAQRDLKTLGRLNDILAPPCLRCLVDLAGRVVQYVRA